ncbi:hypothetical protein VTJ83DRAFT_3124 [Remersonia thermophila]|uniref:Rhodopsin domain-containing protein n=1 Tax=Remersonia thermophila TaxID=72144 RepID=A0ABR4DD56_9PEZI
MAPTNASSARGRDIPRSELLTLIWVCFSAAACLVAVRATIRLRSPATTRLAPMEDCWIYLALAALLALCVLETIQLPRLYYITGILSGDVALTTAEEIIFQTRQYLRFQFPITILFWSVLWCVKAAFLALYWRLFRDLTWYRRAWYMLAVFTFLAYGGCILTLTFSCGRDVRNFFGFNTCASPQNVWASNFSVYFSTAVDVFTDLCIMAMPLRLIHNINVSLRQKIGLVCVFSLGFVMIVFAVIRANQSLVKTGFVNLNLLLIWSTLGASISVLVGTLPALKVLITKRARASENRSGSGGSRSSTKKPTSSFGAHARCPRSPRSVALGSVRRGSAHAKSLAGTSTEATASLEEILVQRDVTISYTPVSRPSPARYHERFQSQHHNR